MTTVAGGRRARSAAHSLALAAIVTLAALAIRLPQLQDIPLLTDETAEVGTALEILDGARPLVHSEAYRGPAWAYALALFMRVSGGDPSSARAFAALLGALTAGAACLLAIDLSDRRLVAGVVAGSGVAVATGLTTLGSHVAWSNNATPLWVLFGALCLVRATADATGFDNAETSPIEGARGSRSALAWWAAAGALWGLALQSHPSAIAPLVGAACWWLASARRRRSLRSAAPWIGVLALLVVLLPLIVHNLVRPMDSLHAATVDDQPVARAISVPGLVSGAAGLARQVARVSGVGAGPSDAGPGPSVRHPTDDLWRKIDHAVGAARPLGTLVYAVLLLGALGLSLVRGPRLVGAMAASGALLLVLVNTSWDNFYDSRYVAFLAVLGWVALGVQSAPILGNDARRRGRSLRAATAVSLLALVAYPLFVTAAWYRAERAAGRTNSALVAEADRLSAAARQSGSPIMVDERLRSIELGGGGNGERALVYLTRLRGAHALVADETELRWFLDQPEARVIFVAGPETVARVDAPWQAGTSNEWSVAVIGAPDGALGSPAP